MNRFFRIFVCFLLICVMVVQISPIQAHAISTGVLAAAAISVTIGTLIGLGISTGADTIAHTELAQEAVEVMKQAGYVTAAGTMALTSLGAGRYGLNENLIQCLRDWMYEAGVVQTFGRLTHPVTNIVTLGNATINISTENTIYDVFAYQTLKQDGSYQANSLYLAVLTDNYYADFSVDISGSTYTKYDNHAGATAADGTSLCVRAIKVPGYIGPFYEYTFQHWYNEGFKGLYSDILDGTATLVGGGLVTYHDVALNFVAAPGISLATGYPEWAANSVVIDGETYYPVAVAPTFEETQTFTQADVWVGNGTITDTNTGTGSGTVTVPDNATLKDILAGVLTLPQAIAQAVSGFFANVVSAVQAIPAVIQAIPAAIADIFTPSADVGHFSISLSDYFPFCIPFDIYDFLTCLNADPVAPVIEWVIFERDGTGHPITVDLSPFDSVARILRTLQLLLFCVGLATKTRDLIKG